MYAWICGYVHACPAVCMYACIMYMFIFLEICVNMPPLYTCLDICVVVPRNVHVCLAICMCQDVVSAWIHVCEPGSIIVPVHWVLLEIYTE